MATLEPVIGRKVQQQESPRTEAVSDRFQPGDSLLEGSRIEHIAAEDEVELGDVDLRLAEIGLVNVSIRVLSGGVLDGKRGEVESPEVGRAQEGIEQLQMGAASAAGIEDIGIFSGGESRLFQEPGKEIPDAGVPPVGGFELGHEIVLGGIHRASRAGRTDRTASMT
jgi:hypothetical protein